MTTTYRDRGAALGRRPGRAAGRLRRYPAGPSAEYRIDDSATESTPEAAATEFTVKVAEEAARIRVREAARALVDSETRPGESTDRATLAAEYLNVDPLAGLPKLTPLIDGVLSRTHTPSRAAGARRLRLRRRRLVAVLATGKSWQGRPVAGQSALHRRRRHLRHRRPDQSMGARLEDQGRPRLVHGAEGSVQPVQARPSLRRSARACQPLRIPCSDTLRRHSGGADGNSARHGRRQSTTSTGSNGSLTTAPSRWLTPGSPTSTRARGLRHRGQTRTPVWHAERDGMRVELECTKRKDGPDGFKVQLHMHKVSGIRFTHRVRGNAFRSRRGRHC